MFFPSRMGYTAFVFSPGNTGECLALWHECLLRRMFGVDSMECWEFCKSDVFVAVGEIRGRREGWTANGAYDDVYCPKLGYLLG